MNLKAMEVFVPGAFPKHTYINRTDEGLESKLVAALKTSGILTSISGPSKAGKTVLVERVVGISNLIQISGASIANTTDVWEHVLDRLGVPNATSQANSRVMSKGVEITTKGAIGVPLIGSGEIAGKGNIDFSDTTSSQESRSRSGLSQVIKAIGSSDFVILLDDFHYIAREIQGEVAKQLKEAIRLNVKIVVASVTHRGDDVVRANPELRGRLQTIDVPYWKSSELVEIAKSGFGLLNIAIDESAITSFAAEAAGSPQLMQSICLNTCFVSGQLEVVQSTDPFTLSADSAYKKRIMLQTSGSTDYRSLLDVLLEGPQTRGTERKTYTIASKNEVDVYGVVLRALASDPPVLSFKYDEIMTRVAAICLNGTPVDSSVTTTCIQIDKLAKERFPAERSIEWDDQKLVLDIPDPYLLFYLRWSGRLN